MNTKKDIIRSLSQDLENLTIKIKKERESKSKVLNDFSQIINTTKKEYENIGNKMKNTQKEKKQLKMQLDNYYEYERRNMKYKLKKKNIENKNSFIEDQLKKSSNKKKNKKEWKENLLILAIIATVKLIM